MLVFGLNNKDEYYNISLTDMVLQYNKDVCYIYCYFPCCFRLMNRRETVSVVVDRNEADEIRE